MNAVTAEIAAANPLENGERRGRAEGLPYRGALTPTEAYAAWKSVDGAVLIDIRTEAELELVGSIPDAVHVEWKLYPDWDLNPSFVTGIQRKYAPETVLLLVCRSGIRSDEAGRKLAQAGFQNVYNVLEGFEGDLNDAGQRRVNGWRSYDLPWNQL